ncbi:hypothetical protein ACEN88_35835, partial [Massilia sp. CT11-108]|uniref:hypothetical protein n=1 Tax=Massilia sp. CT11-108 TaxID=3393900 RepID=UPI0039A51290
IGACHPGTSTQHMRKFLELQLTSLIGPVKQPSCSWSGNCTRGESEIDQKKGGQKIDKKYQV